MPKFRTNYLRAVSMGLLLGMCTVQTLAHPEDLLPLVVAGERVAFVCAWIGGLR